jgi:hypothetical protein
MPRFPDLFFMEMNERKRWIGAVFMRFGRRLRVWKMQFGGLTCDFWAKIEVFGRRVRGKGWNFLPSGPSTDVIHANCGRLLERAVLHLRKSKV